MGIVNSIILANGLSGTEKVSLRSDLSFEEIVTFLVYTNSMKEAAILADKSENSFEQLIRRYVSPLFPEKIKSQSWDNYLLSTVSLFKCNTCNDILPILAKIVNTKQYKCFYCYYEYSRRKSKTYRALNLESCLARSKAHYNNNKDTYISRNIARKLHIKKAAPLWANLAKIKDIYLACPDGYHVDHIIPLRGALVCGLHVESNLQYLSAKENLIKGNSYSIQ